MTTQIGTCHLHTPLEPLRFLYTELPRLALQAFLIGINA